MWPIDVRKWVGLVTSVIHDASLKTKEFSRPLYTVYLSIDIILFVFVSTLQKEILCYMAFNKEKEVERSIRDMYSSIRQDMTERRWTPVRGNSKNAETSECHLRTISGVSIVNLRTFLHESKYPIIVFNTFFSIYWGLLHDGFTVFIHFFSHDYFSLKCV